LEHLDIGARLETFARDAKALSREKLLATGPLLRATAVAGVTSEAPPFRHGDDR
jgi:hypothetical protein